MLSLAIGGLEIWHNISDSTNFCDVAGGLSSVSSISSLSPAVSEEVVDGELLADLRRMSLAIPSIVFLATVRGPAINSI